MNIFITVIIACLAFIVGFLLCAAFTVSKDDELPKLPDEPISCKTCKGDKCVKCATEGMYKGYERKEEWKQEAERLRFDEHKSWRE